MALGGAVAAVFTVELGPAWGFVGVVVDDPNEGIEATPKSVSTVKVLFKTLCGWYLRHGLVGGLFASSVV